MSEKDLKKKSGKPNKSIRLWPGIAAGILVLLFRYVVPLIGPDTMPELVLGAPVFGVIIILWWLFFSRARWLDRVIALSAILVGLFGTRPFLHQSIAEAGMGILYPVYAIPYLSLALVVWAVLCRNLSVKTRRITMIAVILMSCLVWTLFKYGGITGGGKADFSWRWAETSEDLLAGAEKEVATAPWTDAVMESAILWPGFRGAQRDGVIRGVQIETDWSASPPVELWRRPVGPGWSSFAVLGSLFYTQDQRGEEEIVACYHVETGEPVWIHRDQARFWEAQGGAGPRATPTLNDGRVYALGATGILNVLDALDGRVIWSRDLGTDTDTKVPTWGFSSSPLIVDDKVLVAAASTLIAYESATGQILWSTSPAGIECYSSPHLANDGGLTQILLQNESGTISVLPEDGTLLWEHAWPGHPIVQPALITDKDILISTDERSGVRRITVKRDADGWSTDEQWTSTDIKPYFNDSVIHEGHVYGFDGPRLACLDVRDGTRKWRGGRYGRGQLILLADQDLLLVLSEKGELALVGAVPDGWNEFARMPAIEGKTWNHPVLAGDILLVRNGREMAAYRMIIR